MTSTPLPPTDPTPGSPGQPSWTQPSWSQRTQLRRSATDSVLGGVCGGLAEYSGVDALLWRVGFLAFALAGPGALVYLLLFLLMPLGPAPAGVRPSPLDRLADRLRGRTPDPRPAA